MHFVEELGTATIEEPVGIRLDTFEEAVVVFGAVQKVLGEDHPLLWPTDEVHGRGDSLYDDLYKEDDEHNVYVGEDREAILSALQAVAVENAQQAESLSSTQAYELLEQLYALPTAEHTPVPASQPSKKPAALDPPRVERTSPAPIKPLEIGYMDVTLNSFEQLIAARRAVVEFYGEGHDLLQPRYSGLRDDDTFGDIWMALGEETSLMEDQSWTFQGNDAEVVLEALKMAADRREPSDAVATDMLATART